MQIERVSLQHVRSHHAAEFALSPRTTVITGANGSGKTTILEAIYTALQGSTFRGSDKDLLQAGESWWRVDITDNDGATRQVTYDTERPGVKKRFIIDEKTSARLPYPQRYPVVLFEPDDLRLLSGSPERRRRFIDRFISQIDPMYSITLRRYDRALKQRNNALKQPNLPADELFVWNVALAEYGAEIIDKRTAMINALNEKLTDTYHTIAQSRDVVAIRYSQPGLSHHRLLAELEAKTNYDKATGNTSVGPHRHDLLFDFNDSPAPLTASRGEIRTIVLALKFLEVGVTLERTGHAPIILLDDVFSELDPARQKTLSEYIHDNQIIITSTHTVDEGGSYTHITL